MRLVYTSEAQVIGTKSAGDAVEVGDEVRDFRGDLVKVLSITEPHKPSSTGRVYAEDSNKGFKSEFFPGVINAEWVGRTDQS